MGGQAWASTAVDASTAKAMCHASSPCGTTRRHPLLPALLTVLNRGNRLVVLAHNHKRVQPLVRHGLLAALLLRGAERQGRRRCIRGTMVVGGTRAGSAEQVETWF